MQTSLAVVRDDDPSISIRRSSPSVQARAKRAVTPLVLLAESDARMRAHLSAVLCDQRMRVIEADTGRQGLAHATAYNPDIVIIDFGLPDLNGIQVTTGLRAWSDAPIFILSKREHENHRIPALDSGANEYLTRPFGTGELLARVRVWLRHHQRASAHSLGTALEVGPFRIDFGKLQAFVRGHEVRLTRRQYKLFETLMRSAGEVLTHEQIMMAVWGPAHMNATQYLRVYMGQLRRKFEIDAARPYYLLTEPGIGYRLRKD
jgi:two-component system, OmpR family, KDP operon response regulator KdpE